MSTRLPVEIIQQILECIEDKSSLENLFRVARPLTQRLIAAIVYRTITIVTFAEDVKNLPSGIFKGLHIHQLIVHDFPWLAPYVEQLTLIAGPRPSADVETAVYITEVLPVLINLKRFLFADGSSSTNNCIFLEGSEVCCQPSLTHFIFRTDISNIHADTFARFLASQPQLEHLEVHADIPALNLPAGSLQKLRLLRSHPTFAISILPGRHITDLTIYRLLDEGYLQSADVQLNEAFGRIQTLQAESVVERAWAEIVQRFVNLEFFKVIQAPLSITLMNGIVVASKPAKLRYLQIASSWNTFEQEESLVPPTFERLPSLQVIDYEIWGDRGQFVRVCRDMEEPKVISIPRDVWKPWWHGCQLEAPGANEDH